MNRLLFYIVALAIAVGCNDTTIDELDPSGPNSATAGGETIFVTLNVALEGQEDTRVSITPGEETTDPWNTSWDEGDVIAVYSLEAENLGLDPKCLTAVINEYGDATFSGEVYAGKNRIIYNKNFSAVNPLYTDIGSSIKVDLSPTGIIDNIREGTMISSEVINIESDSLIAEDQTLYVTMKHLFTAIDLQLEFTGVPDWLHTNLFRIDIESAPESGYVDVVGAVYIDPTKGVDDEDLYVQVDNLSGTTNITIDQDILIPSESSCSVPILFAPFTLKSGEKLYTKFWFGGGQYYVEAPITNTTESDFDFLRGTQSYVKKSVDLSSIFDGLWYEAIEMFDNSGGESAESPITIASEGQLAYLAAITNGLIDGESSVGKYYKLTADLDLNDREWVAIGFDSYSPFQGHFDGGGYTVSNVEISSLSGYIYGGLFGSVSDATVSNLTVCGADISGYSIVGGVVGYIGVNSTLSNCHISGSVTLYAYTEYFNRKTYLGGVVGYVIDTDTNTNTTSTIENCSSDATLIFTNCESATNSYVGGVVGYSFDKITIKGCHNDSDISATGINASSTINVGGVVGYSYTSFVSDCYNTGAISSGNNYVGGVVGYSLSSSTVSASVTGCYNTGAVSGEGGYVGGVVGYSFSSVTDCHNEGGVSGESDYVGGVVGLSSSSSVSDCYNTGCLSGKGSYVGGVVGDSYATSSSNRSSVSDCYNEGDVSGEGDNVGGVAGRSNYSTVTDCYNEGVVSGVGDNVGGVVGYFYSVSTITSTYYSFSVTGCYNTGYVSGKSGYVGGVVGYSYYYSPVTGCYNTGDVSGVSDYVGGVVGYSYYYSDVIACYNMGAISGEGDYVGGVAGAINKLDSFSYYSYVVACYNTGAVSGSGDNVKGVVGYSYPYSSEPRVINCYYYTGVTVPDDSYATGFSTVAELNGNVDAMNEALNTGYSAADVYYTVVDSNTTLPSLMDEVFTLTTTTPVEGYKPGVDL